MKTRTIILLIQLSLILTSLSCNKWAKYLRNSSIVVNPDPIINIDGNIDFELKLRFPISDYKKVDSINYYLTYNDQGVEHRIKKIQVVKKDFENSIDEYEELCKINKNIDQLTDTTYLQLQTDIYRNGKMINSPKLPIAWIINKNER